MAKHHPPAKRGSLGGSAERNCSYVESFGPTAVITICAGQRRDCDSYDRPRPGMVPSN